MIQNSRIPFFTLIIFISIVLLLFVQFKAYTNYTTAIKEANTMKQVAKDIRYLDEVLTMSAMMATYTSNLEWITRYDYHVNLLDEKIAYIIKDNDVHSSIVETKKANDILVSLELKAFDYVQNNEAIKGQNLLQSSTYLDNKIIYANGLNTTIDLINKKTEQTLNIQKDNFLMIMTITVMLIILIALFNFYIIKLFRQYTESLELQQKELQDLHNTLEQKVIEKTKENRKKDTLILEQSRLVSMGEMIGNIAHQWRQPLSVISSLSTGVLVRKDLGILDDKLLEQDMNHINDNAQFLSQTIDDFRNFVKGDRKAVEFTFNEVIKSLLNLVEGSRKANNIETILDLEEDINIIGHPNELTQCLINIFNNSKDVLKEKDDLRYFFITSKRVDKQLAITLKDNGGGIDENVLQRIFEPYFTTKHQSQGTGLGLSMTFNLITEGMNGKIEASNISYIYNDTNYTGAQFQIVIPLSKN